jgi:RimJ/RimL family protein N-acetyltransferase
MLTSREHMLQDPATLGDWARLSGSLEGRRVTLEPLSERHRADLRSAGVGAADVWRWLPENAGASDAAFDVWFDEALAAQRGEAEIPYSLVDRATGAAIGSTRLMSLRPGHRGLEVGWTWIAQPRWRSGANTEMKLLLLAHCFERLECMRVEFKTDSRNRRSRTALEGIGARFDGVFPRHMLVHSGIRDTAFFSVTDLTWPLVRAGLEERLRRHGS